MTKKSGFTLIELLLVLAIIGIISAIAIPALLGQRARARDKSAAANVASIIPDMIGTYDRLKEGGTTPQANIASIFGSTGTPTIPAFWTAVNPWATSGATTGYNQTALVGENAAQPGVATAAAATATNLGQVQVGYVAPGAGANGAVAASVWLNSAINGSNNFTQSAGLD